MSKINILDESIYNKISAGEVVERPASVVKELLDNAIDAGAKNISISIVDGGIKNITIIDNGSGIEPDDFDKVFAPHATSKIKTAEDLAKIGTLGFRGEALASIASVSKVTLTSKIQTETFARTCTCFGGKQSETEIASCDVGTTISVDDIFFNVPARAKFLKKPRNEMAEITNLVERYILCNPFISFKYVADEKVIYQSTGTNLFDAIYTIYGQSAIDGITKVDYYNSNSGIKIDGYISLPTFSKPNRTYQTLSINGRYVSSQLVSTCIYNAYEHYLMKGQFPFYVLNLQIPIDKLDVNVHPTKMEVRFGNSNEIYGNVYGAVNDALSKVDKITSIGSLNFDYKEVSGGSSFSLHSAENTDQNNTMQTKIVEITSQKNQFENVKIEENKIEEDKIEPSDFDKKFASSLLHANSKSTTGTVTVAENKSSIMQKIVSSFLNDKKNEQTMLHENLEVKSKTEEFFETSDVKFIGQIFSLYLIVQKGEKVYLIDEHAGHERLLFDRLVREVNNRQVTKQNLLSAYVLDVNNQEAEFFEEHSKELESLGFDIQPFGKNTYAINAIPSVLVDLDVKKFMDTLLSDLSNLKTLKTSDLITERLMQHSCKCAVRAGKILSSGEVNTLIQDMKDENMQLQCTHGRPVVVEITKTEIEKWFKRIVWKSLKLFVLAGQLVLAKQILQ